VCWRFTANLRGPGRSSRPPGVCDRCAVEPGAHVFLAGRYVWGAELFGHRRTNQSGSASWTSPRTWARVSFFSIPRTLNPPGHVSLTQTRHPDDLSPSYHCHLWHLVEMTLPIARHAPRWSRCRLIGRVMLRISECRAFVKLVGGVIPVPVLPGLKTSDQGVTRTFGVPRRVLARGRVAATDVAAFCAPPEMQPPSTALKTLDTPSTTRWHRGIDAVVFHRLRLAIPRRRPRPVCHNLEPLDLS
jgi:hypothetical protein